MEIRHATPTALCVRSLTPVLVAIEGIARDDSLDASEVALRLDQFEQCALGAPCAELAFDPVAAQLVALVPQGEERARWAPRVSAYFAALRRARTSCWSATRGGGLDDGDLAARVLSAASESLRAYVDALRTSIDGALTHHAARHARLAQVSRA